MRFATTRWSYQAFLSGRAHGMRHRVRQAFAVAVLASCFLLQVGPTGCALAEPQQAERLNDASLHPDCSFFKERDRWLPGSLDAARSDPGGGMAIRSLTDLAA